MNSYQSLEHLLGRPNTHNSAPLSPLEAWEKQLLALLDLKEKDILTDKQVQEYLRKTSTMTAVLQLAHGGGLLGLVGSVSFSLFSPTWWVCFAFLVGSVITVFRTRRWFRRMLPNQPTTTANSSRQTRFINVWLKTQNKELRQKILDFLPYHESPNIPWRFWDQMHDLMQNSPYPGGVMHRINFEEVVRAKQEREAETSSGNVSGLESLFFSNVENAKEEDVVSLKVDAQPHCEKSETP